MRITILLLLLTTNAFSQTEPAILNLYRINAVCSGCDVSVMVNDEYVTSIKNREKIELTFKNSSKVKITISSESPKFSYNYTFELEKGEVYHYNVKPRIPRAKGFKIKPLDDSLFEYEFKERAFILD